MGSHWFINLSYPPHRPILARPSTLFRLLLCIATSAACTSVNPGLLSRAECIVKCGWPIKIQTLPVIVSVHRPNEPSRANISEIGLFSLRFFRVIILHNPVTSPLIVQQTLRGCSNCINGCLDGPSTHYMQNDNRFTHRLASLNIHMDDYGDIGANGEGKGGCNS